MNVSRRRIIQRRIKKEIYKIEKLKIDVGCGEIQKRKRDGYIGIDIFDFGQEIVWDVEDCLPFADDSIEAIFTEHTLEHLESPIDFLNECWRVLKKDKIIQIIVPHVCHSGAYEFTHTHFYNEESFKYLARGGNVADRYGFKIWKDINTVTNKRKDIHIYMKPEK